MKILSIILGLSFIMSLVGCQFVQQVEQVPLDKQCQLITSITRTTTYFALKEVAKDPDDRIKIATNIVEIIKCMRGDATVNISKEYIFNFLNQYFSSDYALFLQNAIDILDTYYNVNIDVSGIIGDDNKLRLEAFLIGIQLGAEITIPGTKRDCQSPLYYSSKSWFHTIIQERTHT